MCIGRAERRIGYAGECNSDVTLWLLKNEILAGPGEPIRKSNMFEGAEGPMMIMLECVENVDSFRLHLRCGNISHPVIFLFHCHTRGLRQGASPMREPLKPEGTDQWSGVRRLANNLATSVESIQGEYLTYDGSSERRRKTMYSSPT